MQSVTRQREGVSARVEDQKPESYLRLNTAKSVVMVAYLTLLACLTGYVPGWLAARGHELEINELRSQTRVNSIRISLAEAALNANRGEFEEARRNSSEFFTNLQAELDREDPLFGAEDRSKLDNILSKRDEVITQLSRSDQHTTTLLSGWYFTTEKLFQGR